MQYEQNQMKWMWMRSMICKMNEMEMNRWTLVYEMNEIKVTR